MKWLPIPMVGTKTWSRFHGECLFPLNMPKLFSVKQRNLMTSLANGSSTNSGQPAGATSPRRPPRGRWGLVAWLQAEADDYECIGCEDSAAKCNRAAELLQQQEAEILTSTGKPMTDYRALCAELFKVCETLYKQSVTASHHQTITLSNGEHPIPISSDMLAQDAVFGDLLHRTRAADLLEQRYPTPVPAAIETRYEFCVYDENYIDQAGGTAPTYAQALSEGRHYLAQYQQDGPHTLELRRIELLPLPQGEPQS